MPRRPLAATALLAVLCAAIPAAAQVRPVNPTLQAQPQLLHQPTNLELQIRIDQLTEQVSQLSDRLAALNQHIASLSNDLGTLKARESDHFARAQATLYVTCKLLYQHHWAPNGATPTPGNPYVPDEYCTAAGWQAQFKD
jgi:hypothetical protein